MSASGRRVVVTGLGLVTPLGVGVQHAWRALLGGKTGTVSLVGKDGDERYGQLSSTVGGLVPRGGTDASGDNALGREQGLWRAEDWLSRGDVRSMALFTQYAVSAATQALEDSGWVADTDEKRERSGVCIGSGIGSFDDVFETSLAYDKGGFRKVSPLFVPRLLINMAAGHVSMRFGFRGPNHAASTACTTGNHVLGDASRFIQFGDADVVVAGGAEACIHPLAVAGFARAKSLATAFNETPERASRPFDQDRCGFVIGEGSGCVVLEELEHAKRRGARIYAELKGYGLSADAHHMTAPHEEGLGARLAMSNALRHANVGPSGVGYVNAHATSTNLGDIAENRAIRSLLLGAGGGIGGGDVHTRAQDVNVSSCKGALGHLLGAAGAVESIFTILALHNGVLPPTANLDNLPDNDSHKHEFDLNYIPKQPQEKQVDHALSNSFGFGGTNASLCWGRWKE
ncbi:Mitochondrial beta-keto-acyl synthase [Savitreella phatthalungensis]